MHHTAVIFFQVSVCCWAGEYCKAVSQNLAEMLHGNANCRVQGKCALECREGSEKSLLKLSSTAFEKPDRILGHSDVVDSCWQLREKPVQEDCSVGQRVGDKCCRNSYIMERALQKHRAGVGRRNAVAIRGFLFS